MCHDSFVLGQGSIDSLLTWFVCSMLHVCFLKWWGFVTAAASPFQHFLPAPTPIPPSLPPLISFKTGTRNLVIALINNIKIHTCMYVIAVTGTSVVMHVLVGQSSFNLVESRR